MDRVVPVAGAARAADAAPAGDEDRAAEGAARAADADLAVETRVVRRRE